MSGAVSLLEAVQGLLERTYRMRTGVREVGRFVIGDEGYRRLYGGGPGEADPPVSSGGRAVHAGSQEAPGARTLVRETTAGVRACIYYPDGLIRRLEAHPPQKGLRDANVDAFAVLVEELDHLLCIAERVAASRPLSLFELELHANVSKFLVLERFLSGGRPWLGSRRRTWLRFHLFHKGVFTGDDAAARARYHDAARWAIRLLDVLERPGTTPTHRVEMLRRFHDESSTGKLELVEWLRCHAA